MSHNPKSANNTDINSNFFYDKLEYHINADDTGTKQLIALANRLRIDAAEMEVDSAAMYHKKFWNDFADLKISIEDTMNNFINVVEKQDRK